MKFYIFQVGDLSMWIRDSESGLFLLLLLAFHHLELVNLNKKLFSTQIFLNLRQNIAVILATILLFNLYVYLTFFSLGILKVPWDSLVSISRLWISMSLFFT